VLASLNNTAEETIVHTSWNGATDVAAWRVLAGADPKALKVQTTIAANAFESSTILPVVESYVAVQALDAGGHVLAGSKPASVISYAASLRVSGGAA
jgi:hypothetical protein